MTKQRLDLNEIKAKEILDYCLSYLSPMDNLEIRKFKKHKHYKEMYKEIKFLIESS